MPIRETGDLIAISISLRNGGGGVGAGPVYVRAEVGTRGNSMYLVSGHCRDLGDSVGASDGALVWHGEIPVSGAHHLLIIDYDNRSGSDQRVVVEWVVV